MKNAFYNVLICAIVFNKKVVSSVGAEDESKDRMEDDMSGYTKDKDIYYKTIWKPRDCIGPVKEDDDVTMIMEYHGESTNGNNDIEKAVTIRVERGQTLHLNGRGMIGMCLGEKRQLKIPQTKIRAELKALLPDLSEISTFLAVELVELNGQKWEKLDQGLVLALLEEVDAESCERVVVDGDSLAVEYEGSLEDGTVFDSSKSRGQPFGPFLQGHRQIIAGYEIALAGRCLGERFKMIVPPHLAYGDQGVGTSIPPAATLHFDVRLVKLNDKYWSEGHEQQKVYRWETEIAVPECTMIAGKDDNLYIHYVALREDGSKFGSMVESGEPYGPFRLYTTGLSNVPGLNSAIDGMCLGETRKIYLPPRLGWAGQFETMEVSVTLVRINDSKEETPTLPEGPPRKQEL